MYRLQMKDDCAVPRHLRGARKSKSLGWMCYLVSSNLLSLSTLKITEEEVDAVRVELILSIVGIGR